MSGGRAVDGAGADGGRDARSDTDDDLAALTFEQLLAALESLTDRMAAGDIGIEEAAALYERAGRLHAAAAQRLAAVEERVARLQFPASPEAADDERS